MISKFIFTLFILSTLAACSLRPVPSLSSSVFRVSKKSLFKIKEDQVYTFGYLEVPENRSIPNGRTIQLPVYIFKSRTPNPPADPIIYTVGGPGSTTMPSAQYAKYYRYLDDRDFIFFEQRGTKYAQPHLDCPEWSQAIYWSGVPGFDQHKTDSLLIEAAASCRKRLTQQGIDLNAYHTKEIAADIEDLRKALGITSYNLLTISYSTKIAQVLIRDYPYAIRSVVMDSPLPLAVNYDEESNANLIKTLDLLFAECQSSPDCQTAFPDIKKRFLSFLEEKTTSPLSIAVTNPNSGEKEEFLLQGKDLVYIFTSANTSNLGSVPYEINKLLQEDYSSVESILEALFDGPGTGEGMGMRLSVWCSEEYPFVDQKIVAKETQRYPAIQGLSPAVFRSSICETWRVRPAQKKENEAIKSDIPVLLISGEYDHITPPKWAASMQNNLSNSYHLIFNGWKHTPTTNWSNPCAMIAANAFFNNPTTQPQPACVDKITKPKFKLE